MRIGRPNVGQIRQSPAPEVEQRDRPGTTTDPDGRERLRSLLLNVALKLGAGATRQGKRSGWTFDCRELLLSGSSLRLASSELWARLRQYRPTAVGGETLAADPMVSGLVLEADRDGYPLDGFIVRRERKTYSMRRLVEGPELGDRSRVILVDDLINTGSTFRRVVAAIRRSGATVVAAATLVDYQRSGGRWAAELGIPLISLFTVTELGLAVRMPTHGAAVQHRWSAGSVMAGPVEAVADLKGGQVAVANAAGDVVVLDDGGQVVWTKPGPGRGEPDRRWLIRAGDRLVVGARRGELSAVDARSGEPQWASTAPGGDTVVAVAATARIALRARTDALTGGVLAAYDAATGDLLWECPLPGKPLRPLQVTRRRAQVAIGCADGSVLGIDARTGVDRWRIQTGLPIDAGLLVTSRLAYASAGGVAMAIDVRTGGLVWRRRLARRLSGWPVIAAGLVVAIAGRRLVALDPGSGSIVWITTLSDEVIGSPVAHGESVVLQTRSRVHIVDAPTGELRATFPFGEHVASVHILAEGRVLVADPNATITLVEIGPVALRAATSPPVPRPARVSTTVPPRLAAQTSRRPTPRPRDSPN